MIDTQKGGLSIEHADGPLKGDQLVAEVIALHTAQDNEVDLVTGVSHKIDVVHIPGGSTVRAWASILESGYVWPRPTYEYAPGVNRQPFPCALTAQLARSSGLAGAFRSSMSPCAVLNGSNDTDMGERSQVSAT